MSGSPAALAAVAACCFCDPAFPKHTPAHPSLVRKCKRFLTSTVRNPVFPLDVVHRAEALLAKRLSMPERLGGCRARTFLFFQCKKAPHTASSSAQMCLAHAKSHRRYGRMGDTPTQQQQRAQVLAHFCRAFRYPEYTWYSRDASWTEACKFGLDGVSMLSSDQYLLALRAVHEYYRQHPGIRNVRGLEPLAGPRGLQDRGTEREDYLGPAPREFKFFSIHVFRDELRGSHDAAFPETASERQFMAALRATHKRLSSWSICHRLGEINWF